MEDLEEVIDESELEGCILVVDDNPSFGEIIEGQLKGTKCRVLKAYDGETALDILKKNKVDLVFLDIVLDPTYQKMNGYDVLRLMRKRTKNTSAVMFSERSGEVEEENAEHFGAVDYITKPFERKDIIQAIAKYVK